MHILQDFISIEDLKKRWRCEKELIESFTYKSLIGSTLTPWYATEIRTRPDGGKSAIVKKANYLNGCVFDMADVLVIESNYPELVQTEPTKNDVEDKMIDGKFVFTEHQLIKKEDLYKKWFGATHEEIAAHFNNGELRAYGHYKGPINGVIWCKPGNIYYQDRHDCSNPGLYDYNDDLCDYFLLEDVGRCEAEHPEYAGNITPEDLGLVQGESSNEPQGKPEYIPVENLQKTASLSPSRFVELLRTHRDYLPLHGFFSDNDRLFFYDEDVEPVRALDVLSGITVHYLDWKNFILEMEKEGREKIESNGDGALPEDVSDLEPQLAEAQKHIEALEQWNKRLNEQNKKLRPELAEKNSRIAELESLLAISAESKGKRDNSAAIIGKLRKDLQRWKTAFPLAVYATEKLLTHPAETTKKTRSELLPFICEVCPSKCAEPKIPCAVFSKEQFEVWRDAVPPAHVDKSDKADKEDSLAHPLNTVETVGGEGNIEN